MPIPLPQVLVFQEFNLLPSEITDPLRPFLFGPEYALHRYTESGEKGVSRGDYDPDLDKELTWNALGRKTGSVVDPTYTKVFLEDALLQYLPNTALTSNTGIGRPVSGYKNRVKLNSGAVSAITVTAAGSAYTTPPTVGFTGGGGGTGAAATAKMGVAAVAVTAGGTGYTNGAAITVTGGGGSGAAGTIVVPVVWSLESSSPPRHGLHHGSDCHGSGWLWCDLHGHPQARQRSRDQRWLRLHRSSGCHLHWWRWHGCGCDCYDPGINVKANGTDYPLHAAFFGREVKVGDSVKLRKVVSSVEHVTEAEITGFVATPTLAAIGTPAGDTDNGLTQSAATGTVTAVGSVTYAGTLAAAGPTMA
jgi:hypothetical protein